MSPFLTTLGGGSARGFGRGKLIVSLGTPPPMFISGNYIQKEDGTWTNTWVTTN